MLLVALRWCLSPPGNAPNIAPIARDQRFLAFRYRRRTDADAKGGLPNNVFNLESRLYGGFAAGGSSFKVSPVGMRRPRKRRTPDPPGVDQDSWVGLTAEALQVFCGGKSAAEHLERFAEGSSWEARRG
jgi:hypothetical protein